VVALAVALALACGESREERLFDDVGRQCEGFVGSTIDEANRLFVNTGAYARLDASCNPSLVRLPNDACAPPTAENSQCPVFWYFFASDPGLCGPQGGCCLSCEVRVMASDRPLEGAAPICAARWRDEQLCP
jgi:hypothetical protein